MRFERAGAKQPRVVRFDHWGAPKAFGGSNLARSSEPLSSLPAVAGGANWRVDRFHRSSFTAVSLSVQYGPPISAVSHSPSARSDLIFIFLESDVRVRQLVPLELFD